VGFSGWGVVVKSIEGLLCMFGEVGCYFKQNLSRDVKFNLR
jgi:hypothetical protein